MFDRIEKLIGSEKFDLIRCKKVLLVGLGGVGGSCLEALVRSGIEDIVIIDYDVIDVSNLNRQVITFYDNIGQKKTDVAFDFCKRINPNCNIKKYDLFLNDENISNILENENVDYIIDACDSIKTKEMLILESNKRKIKMISCMGTGNKLNPSLLQMVDISKTKNDPIARIIRKFCKDNMITRLPVVSSVEIPIKKDKIISTMSFVPNTAGILLANYIILDIIK